MASVGNKTTSTTKNINVRPSIVTVLGEGLMHSSFIPKKLIRMVSFLCIILFFTEVDKILKLYSTMIQLTAYYTAFVPMVSIIPRILLAVSYNCTFHAPSMVVNKKVLKKYSLSAFFWFCNNCC